MFKLIHFGVLCTYWLILKMMPAAGFKKAKQVKKVTYL